MSITSNITTDTNAKTGNLSVLSNTNVVSTVTYSNITKQFTFNVRNSSTLNVTDFINKLNLYSNFNRVLEASNFNSVATTPISDITTEISDDGISQLLFIIRTQNHDLQNYTCTYPNGSIIIAKRNQATSITAPTWNYLLNETIQFISIVKKVYFI